MKENDHFDVAVIGGGPAGLYAAIQAGRAGASTLLVEKHGILGGTTVVASVNIPGLFHARGKQVIRGIPWELVTSAVKEVGGKLPDFQDLSVPHWEHQITVDRAVYAALADQAVLDAGVDLLLHTMLANACFDDGKWELSLCCLEGLKKVTAGILIDCTGDANVVTIAGGEVERNEHLQPATIIATTAGYDLSALDIPSIETAFQEAAVEGLVKLSDLYHDKAPVKNFLRADGSNSIHVVGVDAKTSAGRTHAEVEARGALLRILRFFRSQPGLENFHFDYAAVECGIRETVTIKAKVKISGDDYTGGRHWEDAVCYSYYPIDIHRDDGMGVDIRPLNPDIYPTIPRRAMLPEKLPRCIVAGRCISGDKVANSAYRVQVSCMAMGQAAGAMAALAAKKQCEPENLDMADLHALLREHDAIIPYTEQLP